MDKEIITFGDIEIEERKFHQHKNLIYFKYVGITNIKVSSRVSSGEKIINILLLTKMMIIKLNQYV